MSPADYRASWNPSEREFQTCLVDAAQRLGYLVFHPYEMRRSNPGFPDLTLVGRTLPPDGTTRTIFIEVKTNRGRVRREQRAWLMALEKCPGVEVYLVRPKDWDRALGILAGGPTPAGDVQGE